MIDYRRLYYGLQYDYYCIKYWMTMLTPMWICKFDLGWKIWLLIIENSRIPAEVSKKDWIENFCLPQQAKGE
jgi:hypothetical protein